MLGGKTNSGTRPTALGTMLNASTYGATIPTIYGTTRTALLAIWAANLRTGGSGKKAKKKGVTTYVENVDFLIGSNPIEGCLQVWSNNTNRYTLNFVRHRVAASSMAGGNTPFPWMNSFAIVDDDFYSVVAVTAELSLSGTFSDYGGQFIGAVATAEVAFGGAGSGYAVNDSFAITGGSTITGGDGNCNCHVTAVGGGGAVTAFVVDNPGTGYKVGSSIGGTPTIALTGSGTGLGVNVLAIGQAYSDSTSEYPLWNVAQNGPDLIQPAGVDRWPFVYYWTPAFGNVIFLPSGPQINWPGGFYDIYYAQLNSSTKHEPPITFNRMTFESELGNGTEYFDAGLAAQQIIYPFYAGLGSSDIDLGATGMLPQWRVEVKGSFGLNAPRGDADFADMIIDTFKSGQIQVGAQLGLIQRGVNCNDLPGVIQADFYGQTEAMDHNNLVYFQPNGAGNMLIAFYRWRGGSGTNASISDLAGNTWNPVMVASVCILATAVAMPFTQNVVTGVFNGAGFAFDPRGFIMEMDPGSDTIEDTDVQQGTTSVVGQTVTCSVTVSKPSFILVFSDDLNATNTQNNPHFTDFLSSLAQSTGVLWPTIQKRYVSAAGTYTWSETFSGSGTPFNIAMIAISQSQPSPLPKALGNIIDADSLQLTRYQCRANGLWGSIAMDSQRPTSDWLTEFYQCANAAPVWSGFKLKSIPRSEVSAVGNGVVYTSPTASGPVATLTENDLIGDNSTPIVTIERKAQVDANNIIQVEHVDRNNDYNVSTASQPESGAIALFGPRKQAPISLHEIQDPAIARKILAITVRRLVYLRNTYKFTMKQKWIALEAMDLILINDSQTGLVDFPVRLTKITENDRLELECEAEPFIYGLNAPNALEATTISSNNPDSQSVPSPVNTPIIFEPPLRMCLSGAPELWIVVSDPDTNYGGSIVYISTDGGGSYADKPLGIINGNGTTGNVTVDWPAAFDPDTTNDLSVDLTESHGTLDSFTAQDRDAFVFPNYVGASPSPTPSVASAGVTPGDIEPAECIIFNPGLGVDLDDLVIAVARCRNVLDGQVAAYALPAFVPPPDGGGPPQPTGGKIRLAEGSCAGTDPVMTPIYDEHTFTCPCKGRNLPTQLLYVEGSGGFRYNFEVNSITITGKPGGAALVAAGPLGSTVSFQEASFDSSGFDGATGTNAVMLVKVWPSVPGNPGLFVALVAGDGARVTPAGWTAQGSGSFTSIFTMVGTHVDPPSSNYELMTYSEADLTSLSHYTMPAAALTPLRRAVFGLPKPGLGEDHSPGSRFAALGSWQTNATIPGILKVPLDPVWLRKALFFKFVPFNALGGGLGDLSDSVPYPYIPVGLASGVSPGGGSGGGGTSGQPGQTPYTITGGQLTQPHATEIDMAQATVTFPTNTAIYNARTFTIPAITVPTPFYVFIQDTAQLGDSGTSTNLTAICTQSSANVGVPGWIYIGSIVALPGGGGTVTTGGGFPPPEQILVNGV